MIIHFDFQFEFEMSFKLITSCVRPVTTVPRLNKIMKEYKAVIQAMKIS